MQLCGSTLQPLCQPDVIIRFGAAGTNPNERAHRARWQDGASVAFAPWHFCPNSGYNGRAVARLLNRFGRRLCVLEHLNIEYPVGRAGSRFEALLPTGILDAVDVMALRHFVVLDDSGNRYPAVIEHVSTASDEDTDFVSIRGVVVTNMS